MEYIWLIPLLPGLGAALNGLVGVRAFSRRTSGALACTTMIAALALSLVAFSSQLHHVVGQVFAVFVIAVAAAEAAVGLGIILAFYRNKETVNIDEMNLMRW